MNRSYKFMDILKQVNDISISKLELYDPDHYDLIVKPHHLKNRLKEKEQQLANLDGIIKHYEEQKKKISEEIIELKIQITPP